MVPSEPPALLLVMPVFNEQASVRKVVLEWFHEVENWTEDFVFLAINDGSTDGTRSILNRLRETLGSRFEILNQDNRGHGQSCLAGYRLAVERDIPYIFQIDSDGQCDPQFFFRLWRQRAECPVIYGVRKHRDDGWRRVLASLILRLFILTLFGRNCADANVPYRLMRTRSIAKYLDRIPPSFSLANIGLAILLRGDSNCRHGYVPIRFRERYGGEPSVKLSLFGRKAFELYRDIRGMLDRSEK
ncbi:MAG: hypothetical protein B9S32_11480 [Verrucomicrobia bacterium Tous-C9LFEB]|nr:MAG: hypothetical protein B9S32_11480 [Verrucomicrobia bacterium Tous-C9LFEB]